jgi:hypothetical protein
VVLALGLYSGLALLVCAPVLPAPGRLALGHPENDVWNHVWGYGWIAAELGRGELPVHSEAVAWPRGGSLWFIDAFNALWTLPVQALGGPVLAYNVAVFGNLVLAGMGAWALARAVTGSRAGALVAGVAYASAPHLLGQLYNGISETLAVGWLPLAVLALRRLFRSPSPGAGVATGALLGVTALANWYYGLFAGLVVLGLFGRELVRRVGPPRRRQASVPGGRLVVAGGIAALVAGAIVAGPFALFARTMNADDALVTRNPAFVWATLVMHNMTDVETFVHPGKFYSPDFYAASGERLLVVVYLGFALLLPAFAALFTRARRAVEPWLLVFVLFLLLALGPFLYVGGAYVQAQGGWIPLPFLALYQWFPMFSRISHAYRFVVGATLALSVMLAFAVRESPRWGVRAGVVAALVGLVRIGESFLFSPAVWPLPVADVTVPAEVAALRDGAVLDLPVSMPVLARSRLLAGQLAHGQPVPFGLNDPVPTALHENHYTRFLVELERRHVQVLPTALPLLDLAAGALALRAQGLRWVVVHQADYHPDQLVRIQDFLDLTARRAGEGAGVRVYELPDGG